MSDDMATVEDIVKDHNYRLQEAQDELRPYQEKYNKINALIKKEQDTIIQRIISILNDKITNNIKDKYKDLEGNAHYDEIMQEKLSDTQYYDTGWFYSTGAVIQKNSYEERPFTKYLTWAQIEILLSEGKE